MMERFGRVLLVVFWAGMAWGGNNAVLLTANTEEGRAVEAALGGALREAGYGVAAFSFADLCDEARLDASQIDLLALPDASSLPLRSVGPIHAFLEDGGDIFALNTPLWQHALLEDGGHWLGRDAYLRKNAEALLQHVVFDFAPEGLAAWFRNCAEPGVEAVYESVPVEDGPAPHALHGWIASLQGWDTYQSPTLEQPFPEGHTLTLFYAKGGPSTTQLSVEWDERDGSRWIATVPLTPAWQLYVLDPSDFVFWESVPARAGSAFVPAEAASVCMGLSFTHAAVGSGEHSYWVASFGTAAKTELHERLLTQADIPAIETLSRDYKFFPCHDVAEVVVRDDQALLGARALPCPKAVRSSHPRPRAAGFDKGRLWRWMPLLEARTADGDWRGTPATMLVHAEGPYGGGVWTSFSVPDLDWYCEPAVVDLMAEALRAQRRGVFLVDGGADHFTYFEEQDPVLGMRLANLSTEPATNLLARLVLRDPAADDDEAVYTKEILLDLAPGETQTISETVTLEAWPEGPLLASATLEVRAQDNAEAVDSAEHAVHCWRPSEERAYIQNVRGDFTLDGKRWRANGINYMPSSGIGTEDSAYFEYWLGARSYDPEVIQRDLDHIADMGLNAVSIFIYRRSMEAQNLLDLLRRLDETGLKANLSLRPGTPMDFRGDDMRELIEYYRLAEHDCIFALDLAWEPMFGDHTARRRWDPQWRQWIDERYASLENAEEDWAFEAPRDAEGLLTNPLPGQTLADGPWRGFVAAYRRFLDTLLYEKYSQARTFVRTVDPVHMVSFRMTLAADPTYRGDGLLPYDWPYLAAAVDILEPEAYGRIGDWERVKPGWFQYEYGRWAAPHLPFLWAEAGVNAWAENRRDPSPGAEHFQAHYYRDLYRMFSESGADGIFFWWYPGGYRVNEKSDYGIVNPDGSDRAVTRVIRECGPAFLAAPNPGAVDHWIAFDRDRHPDGPAGVYAAVQEEFWQAIDEGHTPGLRTEATGTDSSNCPLVAVGNAEYAQDNPPKYLDAFFDRVEVRFGETSWRQVTPGETLTVGRDESVPFRVRVTNLGEAAWRAPAPEQGTAEGDVFISLDDPMVTGSPIFPLPETVPRFGSVLVEGQVTAVRVSASKTVVIGLTVSGRGPFGPRFPLVLSVDE